MAATVGKVEEPMVESAKKPKPREKTKGEENVMFTFHITCKTQRCQSSGYSLISGFPSPVQKKVVYPKHNQLPVVSSHVNI